MTLGKISAKGNFHKNDKILEILEEVENMNKEARNYQKYKLGKSQSRYKVDVPNQNKKQRNIKKKNWINAMQQEKKLKDGKHFLKNMYIYSSNKV